MAGIRRQRIRNRMENNKIKLKIIFLGTSEFGAIVLEGLIQNNYKPILVITAPDKPMGRRQILTPPPVKLLAKKYNIPIEQPEKIKNLKPQPLCRGAGPRPFEKRRWLKIKNLQAELVVTAAYGQILPKEILKIPRYGCLNVHPSLLPKYRGPSPIHTAILNGDKKTGVTIIKMIEKVDSGSIIAQKELISLTGRETYKTLHNQLAEKGANLLIETIPKWIKGEIEPKPQDESKASYTKILTRQDGKIDWKKSAEEIERQIRAFEKWPGSFTFWEIMKEKLLRIKILKAGIFKSPVSKTFSVGKILVVPQNQVGVQCGKDFLIIEELQLEGQKPMSSEEFLRGHPDFAHATLK